jgi:hypothetical protein
MKNRFVVLSSAVGLFAAASMMTAPDVHAVAFTSASIDYFNGSKYELYYTTDQSNVSWDDAKLHANSIGGNLVSITSAGEEATVEGLWGSLAPAEFDKVFNDELFGGCCDLGVWTGGRSDGQGSNWYWDTGEGDYSQWDGTALAGMYTNWHPFHPDNDNNELRMGFIIQTLPNGITGWDNHTGDGRYNMRSFVVESAVPEPSTLVLLSLGLVGLGFTRRRKA